MIKRLLALAAIRKAEAEEGPPRTMELFFGAFLLGTGLALVQNYTRASQREARTAAALWMFNRRAHAAAEQATYPGVDDLDPLHTGDRAQVDD